MKSTKLLIIILHCFVLAFVQAQNNTMQKVAAGNYVPLYGVADGGAVEVDAFLIDTYPVTNAQFVDFLKKNPEYQKSNIKRLFADKSYLAHWVSDLDFGTLDPQAPVTSISWFAAKKYCECEDKRLPTMDEWEYVAMSDSKNLDAREKETYNKYILSWYETPKTYNNKVGSTFKNYWGVYDMHGLVWEWVSDFNSIFLSGESRLDKGDNAQLFCGAASINASDLMNYAAFMRYGFRGSLKASFSTKNLGFRCAKNL